MNYKTHYLSYRYLHNYTIADLMPWINLNIMHTGIFFPFFAAIVFSNLAFSKYSFMNTIRMTNRIDSDQAWHLVGPDLSSNWLKRLLHGGKLKISNSNFKIAGCLQKWIISSLNDWLCSDNLKTNQRNYSNLPNSAFWGWLSVESQPQKPEFRINPENFHPCY